MNWNSKDKAIIKETTALIMIFFILTSMFISAVGSNPQIHSEDLTVEIDESNNEYVETEPIEVEGADDFDEEHWKGSGTEENPYELKENYSIDASGYDYGIKITNSAEYVVIENCEIYGASGETGAGISLEAVGNVEVIDNNLNNNSVGIYVYYNAFGQSSYFARNQITDNELGFFLNNTEGHVVKDNDILNNSGTGIYGEDNVEYIDFISNNISNNDLAGVELEYYSNNNLIEDNIISGNGGHGINLNYMSGHSHITENKIEYNDHGIKIEASSSCEIWRNKFIGNTVSAYDNHDNDWNSSDPNEGGEGGNYWSDYEGEDRGDGIGDEPYEIEGGDNNDSYPWVTKKMEQYTIDRFEVTVDNITAGESPLVKISDAYNMSDEPLEGEYYFDFSIGSENDSVILTFESGNATYLGNTVKKAGEYTIYATSEGITESDNFHVEAADVHNVTISPSENITLIAGEKFEFTAEAFDAYDNFISNETENFTWANASKGTFNETIAGRYQVTALYDGEENVISQPTNVTVIAADVNSVELETPPKTNVLAGEEINLTAKAYDQYGNLVTNNSNYFKWENASKGTFNQTNTGVYEVIATQENFSSEPVNMTVKPGDVHTIELDALPTMTITAGSSLKFDAEAFDRYDNLVTDNVQNFTWENASTGTFYKEEAGEYDVRAIYQSDEIELSSNSCTVTVESADPQEFELLVKNISAGQRPNIEMTDTRDEYGNPVEGEYEVEMNIDDKNITTNLTFTGGSSYYEWDEITVVGNYSTEVNIQGINISEKFHVKTGPPDFIEIEPSEETVTAGDIVRYHSTVYDEWNNLIGIVSGQTDWSINESAKGNWEDNEYESENPGTWNVTGTYTYYGEDISDKVTLTVTPKTEKLEYTGFNTIIFEENLDYNLEWDVDENHTISSYELLAGNSSDELETIKTDLKNESYRYQFEDGEKIYFKIISYNENEKVDSVNFNVTVDLIKLEVEEREEKIFSIYIAEEREPDVNVTWSIDGEKKETGKVFIPDLTPGNYNITAEVSDQDHVEEKKYELNIDKSEADGGFPWIYLFIGIVFSLIIIILSILYKRSKKDTKEKDDYYLIPEKENRSKKGKSERKSKTHRNKSNKKSTPPPPCVIAQSEKSYSNTKDMQEGVDKDLVIQTFEKIEEATKKQAYDQLSSKSHGNIEVQKLEQKIESLVQEEKLTKKPRRDGDTLYIWNR